MHECVKAAAPRQEGTLSLPGTCLDSIWKHWAFSSVSHQSGKFSISWSHSPFLNLNDNH